MGCTRVTRFRFDSWARSLLIDKAGLDPNVFSYHWHISKDVATHADLEPVSLRPTSQAWFGIGPQQPHTKVLKKVDLILSILPRCYKVKDVSTY